MHRFYYDGDGPDDEDGNPGGISFLAVPSTGSASKLNYSLGLPMDIWDGICYSHFIFYSSLLTYLAFY